MVGSHLDRASILLKQNRLADAEREIKNALNGNPNDADALVLLSICFAEQDKIDVAEQAILDALRLRADDDFAIAQHAHVLALKHNYDDAEITIRRAIGLNPYSADYFGFLAGILLHGKKFREALEAAEKGLEIDPENLLSLNQRSTALLKLGKKEDAFDTMDKALERDPDNEYTHATYGWNHLEKGDHNKALEHFREALKRNPNNEYAKSGLVEALKARYWFYRVFMKYNFWVANLSGQMQWAFIIGLWLLMKVVNGVAIKNPSLQPFLFPVMALYILFVLSTWVMRPLSNLLLRLNVYGRYALTKEETRSSTFVGIALAISILSGIALLLTQNQVFGVMALGSFAMMMPLGSMFNPIKRSHRHILMGYTALLVLLGVAAAYMAFTGGNGGAIFNVFVFGIIGYQWLVNFLVIRT